MGDLALALDSGVGPDPARPRNRPQVNGGKRRRRDVAASERAGMGLAESCDDRARRDAAARFFGRAGQATSHSHRCAFRLARREKSAFVIDALQFPGPPANEIDRRTVETFLRWQARLRAHGKGLQDVGATGDAAVANHIYSVADRSSIGELVKRAPRPVELTPAMIGHHDACENKDLRDTSKTKQIGTICLDRFSASSLVYGAYRSSRLEPVR
jgi:hypothetical protein